jgi:hypothetical protein
MKIVVDVKHTRILLEATTEETKCYYIGHNLKCGEMHIRLAFACGIRLAFMSYY